jgi:trigger factor
VKIVLKDAGDARKVAIVTFEAEEVADKEKKVCRDFANQANIPGFRKGKVPPNVIRSRFGKQMNEELKRQVSTDAYEAVLKRDDLRVHSVLKVDAGEVDSSNAATVEVTVDVEADFELPDYESFELSIHKTDVSDEEVEKELSSLCEQRASYEIVERPIEKGDYVKCSYEGSLDGKPVAEIVPEKPIYGKQANTWEEAGAETAMGVKAIAEGLIDMKVEEKKTVAEDFSEDFEIPPLAGKSVSFELEVHEVREKNAPDPASPDFLKAVNVETLDELKEKISKDLEQRKEYQNLNGKRNQITQNLLDSEDFPLPQKAVEDEANAIFKGMAQGGMEQGVERGEIESKKDELWKQAQTNGQARVKIGIVLGRIAEKEEVKVSNEDLAQAATREAMSRRVDPQAYIKELTADRARMSRLQRDVLHDKTIDLIAGKSTDKVCEIEGDHKH